VKEDEVGRACGTQGEERKKLCKILVVKPEGKRPLGRQRRRWEDVIRMDIVGDWLGGWGWSGSNWLSIGAGGGLL
jgi:hypothetical protein